MLKYVKSELPHRSVDVSVLQPSFVRVSASCYLRGIGHQIMGQMIFLNVYMQRRLINGPKSIMMTTVLDRHCPL